MSAKLTLTYAKVCDISPVGQSTNGSSYLKFSVKPNGEESLYHCTIWEDDEENSRSNFKKWKKILRKGDYYNLECSTKQFVRTFLDPNSKKSVAVPTYVNTVKDLEWIDALKQSKPKTKPNKQNMSDINGGEQ